VSNFWKRAVTGTLFVAFVILLIVGGAYSSACLFALVAALGYRELQFLLDIKSIQSLWIFVLFSVLHWFLMLLVPNALLWSFLAYLVVCIVLFVFSNAPAASLVGSIFSFIYLNGSFTALYLLGMDSSTGFSYKPILFVLFLIWANDTGAYLVGRSIGRTKLAPNISPGKTWEGTAGGVIIAMIIGFVVATYGFHLPTWPWVGAALLTGVSCTIGDLFESKLKRAKGVKDSGNLLPGHGGILDRFDALLLAAPVNYLYFSLIG